MELLDHDAPPAVIGLPLCHTKLKRPCDECADPADFDGNRKVDLKDFAYWANRYLHQIGHEEQ